MKAFNQGKTPNNITIGPEKRQILPKSNVEISDIFRNKALSDEYLKGANMMITGQDLKSGDHQCWLVIASGPGFDSEPS